MKFVNITLALLALGSTFSGVAREPVNNNINATIEFDVNSLYDCYNEGELVFFRDGRMTYDGDDFNIIEPERWLQTGDSIEPLTSVGLRFTRVNIEQKAMRISLYDHNGTTRLFDQEALPEVGDEVFISMSDGIAAFTLNFMHDTAALDITFDLFDPDDNSNRSELSFGLNCL